MATWDDHATTWGGGAAWGDVREIELHTNVALIATPFADNHLINKKYVDDHGPRYAPIRPNNPAIGLLWATPEAELYVWTGTQWLTLLGGTRAAPSAAWGGEGIRWGGTQTWA